MKQTLTMKQTPIRLRYLQASQNISLRTRLMRSLQRLAGLASEALGTEVSTRQLLHLLHLAVATLVFLYAIDLSPLLWLASGCWTALALIQSMMTLFADAPRH